MTRRGGHRRSATRIRALLFVLSGTVGMLGAGCGLSADDSPIDIDRPVVGGDDAVQPVPVLATGAGRIFLIAPSAPGVAPRLRAVSRDVVDAAGAMAAVVAGPSEEEFTDEYRSALPADLQVNAVRQSGSVAAIDIGAGIRELGGEALVIALAQIVHTVASVDGIDSVRLTVDGAAVTWPDGTGGSSTEPLTVHDFPGLIPSTQPAFPAIPSPPPA